MPWVKAIHIVCVVLWLGNFVVTGVWSARRVRRRYGGAPPVRRARDPVHGRRFHADLRCRRRRQRLRARGARARAGARCRLDAKATLAILAAATLVWLGVLLPLEVTMLRQTSAGRSATVSFALWSIAGWGITLALFAVIYLMVAKPV